MASRDQVLAVIIEHAVKHRYHTLTRALLKETAGSINIPDIYQVIRALEKIFTSGRLDLLELAAQLIDIVHQLDDRICSFKVYSKLMLGIKMKFLLEYLKSGYLDVEMKLNKYLPAVRSEVNTMGNKEYIQHQECVTSFREFFLPLVKNKPSRDKYFNEEYEAEFGEELMSSLKRLINTFLMQLIQHLPQTKLEMLFARKYEIEHVQGHKDLQRLLEFLQGIMILTEEDLLKFVDIIASNDEKGETSTDFRPSIKVKLQETRTETLNLYSPIEVLTDEFNNHNSEAMILLDTCADSISKLSTVTKTKQCVSNTNTKRNKSTKKETKSDKVKLGYTKDKTNKMRGQQGNSSNERNIENTNNNSQILALVQTRTKKHVNADGTKHEMEKLDMVEDETNVKGNSEKNNRKRRNMENYSKKPLPATERNPTGNIETIEESINSTSKVKPKVDKLDDGALSPVIKRIDKLNEHFKISETLKLKCKRKLDCNTEYERDKKKIKEPVPMASSELINGDQWTQKGTCHEAYTAELWKPRLVPPSDGIPLDLCSEGVNMLSPVNPETSNHFDNASLHVTDNEVDEFPVIPPSNRDPDSDIELNDFEDEVKFDDQNWPGRCIPTLENFRLTSPIKLCVVKLFGNKGGIYT